jgi:hypothetical protein
VRRSLNGRVAVRDRPSPEGAETAIATQTPPRKRVLRQPKRVGRRQSGWCGGALGCLRAKGSREKLKFAARGRKLGRGGNGGLNSGVWCRCEGEREGVPTVVARGGEGGSGDTGSGVAEVGTDQAALQCVRGGNRGGAHVGRSRGKRKEMGRAQ